MNLSYFISKRIRTGEQGGFSSIIHKIAVVSIAVGLVAAIISFLVMKGFQQTIKHKIYGFSAHMLVTRYTRNNSVEEQPFSYNVDIYNNYKQFGFVDHVQEYAHMAGLIKNDNEVLGVVFRGVGKSFDQDRFKENIVAGRFIQFTDSTYSKEVVLSDAIARKLNLKVDDDVIIHFFQNPPRFRKLKIVGLYETNLSEYFDNKIVIGDIRMIQRLKNWSDSTAGGLQIYLKDDEHIDEQAEEISTTMDYDLYAEKAGDTYIQIFEWLGLVGRQVSILLVIILFVVCVNMISVVLILVMERTQMIGVLKAVGASNSFIRKVFVYNGMSLILKGLAFGNVFGLGLCYLQYKFHLMKLNAHDYYMSYVPINWDWGTIVFLNALIFVVVTIVLLLPTAIVSRIHPLKAIKFD